MSRTHTQTDATEQAGGKRWGCLLYSACVVAVLMTLGVVACFFWYGNAKSELESEIARIAERGEPLWFADLEPTEPPTPEDDATPLFLAASAKLKPAAQAFYDRLDAEPATPLGVYDEFSAALDANRPALKLMAEAVKRPYFRLPIDYQTKQPFNILLPEIQNSREFARLLRADVLQSLGAGDRDRAVAAVHECLGLSELFRDEPIIITQLVRYAIGSVAVESLQTAVEHTELTRDEFAALDELLEQMERNCRLRPSIIAERCGSFTSTHYFSENIGLFDSTNDSGEAGRIARLLSSRFMQPRLMSERAYNLRIMTEFADAVDLPGQQGIEAVRELDERVKSDTYTSHTLTRLLVPALVPYRNASLRFRQRLLNARLALRINRYRAEHGKLPSTLAEILDDKLATAADVYTGQSLVYEMTADGFMLYPAAESLAETKPPAWKDDDAKKVNTFKAKFPQPAKSEAKSGQSP